MHTKSPAIVNARFSVAEFFAFVITAEVAPTAA